MTWDNFVAFYGSILWILFKPYIAAMIAPLAYELYMTHQKDLDYIGYTYNELFEYALILVFDNFYGAVDIFSEEDVPFIPELPTIT